MDYTLSRKGRPELFDQMKNKLFQIQDNEMSPTDQASTNTEKLIKEVLFRNNFLLQSQLNIHE